MINDLVQQSDVDVGASAAGQRTSAGRPAAGDKRKLARVITALENGAAPGLKSRC
jgi:hypothetical protein